MTDQVLWMLDADDRRWSALDHDLDVDVAVIGGGIVGLAAAHFLAGHGLRIAVLEARRIGYGATARSTAKATSQHGPLYQRLVSDLGEEGARLYGRGNEEALEWKVGFACVGGVTLTALMLRDFWSYDARTDEHAVAERRARALAGEDVES